MIFFTSILSLDKLELIEIDSRKKRKSIQYIDDQDHSKMDIRS